MRISLQRLSVLTTTSLLLLSHPTSAFFPTNLLTAAGLMGHSHTQITRDALTGLYAELFGITGKQISKAMTKARDEIAHANAEVDKDQVRGEKHFDGESFPEGQYRLITLKKMAVYQMRIDDVSGARTSLGQALHTLQDFYSHTNYPEMKMNQGAVVPFAHLGMEGKFISRLPMEVNTCTDCGGGTFAFIKNFFKCQNCDKNVILNTLTSGYYSGENRVKTNSGKCSHGGPFDGSSGKTVLSRGQGINKDSSSCKFSPHYKYHAVAAKLAQDGSRLFIRDLVRRLSDKQVLDLFNIAEGTRVIRSPDIEQIQPSKAIPSATVSATAVFASTFAPNSSGAVVPLFSQPAQDVTSASKAKRQESTKPHWSFHGVAGVPKGRRAFIHARSIDDHVEPEYADHMAHMAMHNDVRVNAIVSAGSAAAKAYSAVSHPSGGHVFEVHDDEEMEYMDEFSQAVEDVRTVDVMHVRDSFTSTKKAFEYRVPIDSTLGNLTFVASGAEELSITTPDGKVLSSADCQTRTSMSEDVKIVNLKTNELINIRAPKAGSYKVTVKSSTPSTFTVSTSGTSYLDLSEFNFVEVNGRPGHMGYYPIEGAPYTSSEQSSREYTNVASALMSGSYRTTRFSFRTPEGKMIHDNIPLFAGTGEEGEMPSDEHLTPFAYDSPRFSMPKDMWEQVVASNSSLSNTSDATMMERLPSLQQLELPAIGQPFVVYVTGIDKNGVEYQRVVPRTYTPATLQVTPGQIPCDLRHDRETTYKFTISNAGPSDTVDVTAADNNGLSADVTPSSFTLGQGESKTVTVLVKPHGSECQGTNTLVVTAVKRKGGCKNYVTVKSHIRPEVPEYEDEVGYWNGNKPEVYPSEESTLPISTAVPTTSSAPVSDNTETTVPFVPENNSNAPANDTVLPSSLPYINSAATTLPVLSNMSSAVVVLTTFSLFFM